MKSKKQLKKELHQLIDSIEDEHVLNVLNDDVVPYIIQNRIKEADAGEDDLTEEQIIILEDRFREMESGEYLTMNDFKKAMNRWLTK
ncbi:hypothetical protein [Agriterribacter humi]|jgi:hypothetical protein|uniref:hypothetical protein n=1 Tax=Agriterribacter humi TaxID=1104781 RepID=UPI001264C006|nr:hypothetical protein [Agriterribacter humi]